MTRHHNIGIWLVAGLTIVLVGAAAASPKHRTISFTGDCQGSGTVGFTPPLTNTARPILQRARGTLICSGELVDGRGRSHGLTNARVVYTSREQGDSVSCGLGLDSGPGALHFKWGRLHFNVTERRAAAAATLTYTGAKGGSATGVAHPNGDAATAVQQCAGSGIERAGVDLTLHAESISG